MTAVVFLLLGAIVNVAVTWGLAKWPVRKIQVDGQATEFGTRYFWSVDQFVGTGTVCNLSSFLVLEENGIIGADGKPERLLSNWGLIPRLYPMPFPQTPDSIQFHRNIIIDWAAGWPLRAMWCSWTHDGYVQLETGGWSTSVMHVEHGLQFEEFTASPSMVSAPHALPLMPVWRGFIVNTLFYATILFVLFRGPFIARRMIRKHKGRCTKCGYDLRGSDSDACPECGAAALHATS